MIVTDKEYFMEKNLVSKIDLMIQRCTQKNPKKDVLLLIEGAEGEGKSTMSAEIGYYVAFKSGKTFNVDNIHFDLKTMIDIAKSTTGQILVWDEPALEGLSVDWYKETQKNLIKLLMMARKKRHFFIFNITKFYKFNEYIIERAIGMIHVYSRNEIQSGRFVYFKKKNLEALYYTYRSSKKKMYRKFSTMRGSFPDAFEKIINVEEYESKKDKAIDLIGVKVEKVKVSKREERWKKRIFTIVNSGMDIDTLAKAFKVTTKTIYEWKNNEFFPENEVLNPSQNNNIINVRAYNQEKKIDNIEDLDNIPKINV